jgi:hypothetical protein
MPLQGVTGAARRGRKSSLIIVASAMLRRHWTDARTLT